MGADLHAPLGQNRRPRQRRHWRPSTSSLSQVVAGAGLIAFSFYTSLVPLPLSSSAPTSDTAQAIASQAPQAAADRAPGPSAAMRSPTSGAQVQRATMADGSVVTKYSPADRGQSGPALIATPHVGQEQRLAATPNPDLLEDTPQGRVPVVGPDGLRPVEHYARPWSGAHGTRVAIVVGGLGLSQTGTQKALRQLPDSVTLAFAASGNSLPRWMQAARLAGHEILLQVPLEPVGYPANDPGRGTLQVARSASQNLVDLHKAMASLTNYTGVMNYMGARFLTDADALDPVMRDIAKRGLLFLDDGSTAQSLVPTYARTLNMPAAVGDVLLDDQLQEQAILAKLDDLERIARRNGKAIGVASAFDESIGAIAKWVKAAETRGIEVVGVSALAMEMQN